MLLTNDLLCPDLTYRLSSPRLSSYHATSSYQVGGPIGLLKDGDKIVIDARNKKMTVDLTPAQLEKRRKEWVAPPLKATRGTLYKYIKNVSSASLGCVTDE